jgi:hypothetical protein
MFSEYHTKMRETLKGAYLHQHPHRGLVYVLKDGSYMSVSEYERLSFKCCMFLFRGE